MLILVLIAACWLALPLVLLSAVAWVYTRVERRVGHDPLDRVLGQRQERSAHVILFPTQTRRVMGTTKEAPATLSTSGGVSHRSRNSHDHQ